MRLGNYIRDPKNILSGENSKKPATADEIITIDIETD